MGLKQDFEAFNTSERRQQGDVAKKYIKMMWGETLVSPINFDNKNTLMNLRYKTIESIILPMLNSVQSQARRDYYSKCLRNCSVQLDTFSSHIRSMVMSVRSSDLARLVCNYLMRLLMGELLFPQNNAVVLNGDTTQFPADLWYEELRDMITVDEAYN